MAAEARRVAFVVQRYGQEVNGGAELLCRQVAERMAQRRPTEVLTTCALDYGTWADHYRPGVERQGALTIRRFRVSPPRDLDAFNLLSADVRARRGTLPLATEEAWMRQQGPWSPALLDHLEAHRGDHDVFFFFTYLYATTYFGLQRVGPRAVLVPTAHDEWPIHLGLFDRMVQLPRAFLYLTVEEREFMRRRFPGARVEGPVAGAAVEPPPAVDPSRFRARHGVGERYLLYLGRVDSEKGVGRLVDDLEAWRRAGGDPGIELVLAGKVAMPLPRAPWLRAVGFVSEQEKWDALAGCQALVMPSPNESLSIALLEAWALGRPALVNGGSEVLVGQCRRSHGGLWYASREELFVALELLLGDPALQAGLGRQGRAHVSSSYRWPAILDTYCELADAVAAGAAPPPQPP